MMVNRKLMVVALATLLAVFSAAAADKKPNADRAKATVTDASTGVDSVATAHALVRYGDANKDALALITAGKMLKEAGSRQGAPKRTEGKPGEAKAKPDAFAADAVLARAKVLAAGRADLIALADDAAKSGTRGAANGPVRHRDVVASGKTDVYRISFKGGEPARILVSGDGDSDLDLYVYDENDNLICKDDDATDDMICGFNPRWTGPFTVKVKNRGIANAYIMVTN